MNNIADIAERYRDLSIKEVPGRTSHPRILAWIQECEAKYPTDLAKDDSTYAWCGIFVGHCVLEDKLSNPGLALPPKYYQGALRWKDWGNPVKVREAQRDDVIVLGRPGGHHVTIVSKRGNSGVYCTGGNQSNAVTTIFVPWEKILYVRRG